MEILKNYTCPNCKSLMFRSEFLVIRKIVKETKICSNKECGIKIIEATMKKFESPISHHLSGSAMDIDFPSILA